MQPAADAFESVLRDARFSDATIPVVQDSDPRGETDAEVLRGRLVAQIAGPVRWRQVMEELVRLGSDTIVEAGPGAILAGLARRTSGLRSLSAEETGIEAVLEEVA
jgi:[acyl-carrier-protein] S-malonyltransferase